MNRQHRRSQLRSDKSQGKRVAGIAGVSLLAATGLFGAYLGNPRMPRAYATSCSTGTGSATFDVASQADFINAVTTMNQNAVTDSCFTINITSDFTVNQDLVDTSPIEPAGSNLANVAVTLNGNGHTVSGDPSAPVASFFKFSEYFASSGHGDTNQIANISDRPGTPIGRCCRGSVPCERRRTAYVA